MKYIMLSFAEEDTGKVPSETFFAVLFDESWCKTKKFLSSNCVQKIPLETSVKLKWNTKTNKKPISAHLNKQKPFLMENEI